MQYRHVLTWDVVIAHSKLGSASFIHPDCPGIKSVRIVKYTVTL